jgi:hypothetical protein
MKFRWGTANLTMRLDKWRRWRIRKVLGASAEGKGYVQNRAEESIGGGFMLKERGEWRGEGLVRHCEKKVGEVRYGRGA